MKKILICCLAFFGMLLFQGCESEIDHPIAGKVYVLYAENSSTYLYFHLNGDFEIDYKQKTLLGDTHNWTNHLEWTVEGNKISVYHDNSTYWKSHVRGTLFQEGTYESANNTVILNGIHYEFSHNWD